MSEKEVDKLNEVSSFFRRMNSKVILLKLLNKAKAEYDRYDYKNSTETLKQAYELDKNNSVVLRGLGCMEQFAGNYESAIKYFNLALEKSTSKEIEYTLIGMVYYLQDKLDNAVEFFNKAIDVNDSYDKAYEGRNQAMLEHHLKIVDLQDSLKKYF